jgi:hypothetical protein
MDRRRGVEMLTRREFHLHHHQNFPEDEFWPQTPTTGLTPPSLITPIRNPLTTPIRKPVNKKTVNPTPISKILSIT